MSETKTQASTPAAQWRLDGELDPHGTDYDGERATLTLGQLTDDELANGVFMNADQPMDIARILARDPNYHPPIAWLTAAKERIRWLSRALVKAQGAAPLPRATDAADKDAVTREQVAEWAKLAGIHLMFEKHYEQLGDFAIFARQGRTTAAQPVADDTSATVEPLDYDGVVSICEAHGIGLPVDCIEMVVEIIRLTAALKPVAAPQVIPEKFDEKYGVWVKDTDARPVAIDKGSLALAWARAREFSVEEWARVYGELFATAAQPVADDSVAMTGAKRDSILEGVARMFEDICSSELLAPGYAAQKVRQMQCNILFDSPGLEVRNVEGMTRAEFEQNLRICFQHDNVRARERGRDAPINGLTTDQEREIAERVERSYPASAYDYAAKVCPGCTAFDNGASEVEFAQDCEGCKARMQKVAGFGPLAASSAATVSDAACAALSDIEIAALRVAADALIERYASPIRDILKRSEHEPAASSAATASDAASVTQAEYETSIETLRHVIHCLRSTGSYTDEEGEATDYLEPLLTVPFSATSKAATTAETQDEPAAFVRDNPDDIGTFIEATRPLDVGTPLYIRAASSATAPLTSDSRAARDVLAERQRQMSVEGWTPEHDDEHGNGEMARAASCYAHASASWMDQRFMPSEWPWAPEWWKPTTPRRNLVKAGALILAEIERLDRAQSTNGEQS